MLQTPKSDPVRAARARAIAIRLADVLHDNGVDITLPRFLELIQFVAGMLPPAAARLTRPTHPASGQPAGRSAASGAPAAHR